ncbi:MAG: NTP transferase domain-containing protein, partial [Porticoccaceae bacterium]
MPINSTDIVILAAGKGTRMQSALPKVLHPLAGRPLLDHVITSADTVADSKKIIVTGHGAEQVEQTFAQTDAVFVQQTEQLGTAHAVQMALPHLRSQAKVLILYGDVPLITPETISKILNAVDKDHIALLTIHLDNPTGYGRIVRNAAGEIESIVEQKDASDEQLTITEINTGVLALGAEQLS